MRITLNKAHAIDVTSRSICTRPLQLPQCSRAANCGNTGREVLLRAQLYSFCLPPPTHLDNSDFAVRKHCIDFPMLVNI